jgi:UDP-glucose 4-epimerase
MNRESAPQPIFHQCDLRDQSAIDAVFKEHEGKGGIWAVVHLAALKAVGESGEIPLEYYKVNVGGSLNLIEVSPPHRLFFGLLLGEKGETDNR